MADFGYVWKEEPRVHPRVLDLQCDEEVYEFDLLTFHLFERRIGPLRQSEHSHDLYHIVLYTEGENEFQFQGGRHRFSPGTLVLSSPGDSHDYGPVLKGVASYHEITFALRRGAKRLTLPMEELFGHYSGVPLESVGKIRQLADRQLSWCELYYQRLHERLKEVKPQDWFFVYCLIMDFFCFLINELFLHAIPAEQIKPDSLVKAKELIERHYSGDLSISELATRINMSQEHFSRSFKARYGVSPSSYRQSLRVGAAKSLLKTSGLSCGEIAERIGYSDIYSFSRSFKHATNMSPEAFRNS